MNTTLTCSPGTQAYSMWSSSTSCNVHTATKMIMEIIVITAGCFTLISLLFVLQSSFDPINKDSNRSSTSSTTPSTTLSIQKKARACFLIHTLIYSCAQIAMFTLAVVSDHPLPPQITGILIALIAWGVMGGTIHACSLWFFVLPLRFLRQRPSMVLNIGRYFDGTLPLDVLYFFLYLLITIPSLFYNDLRWTVRLVQIIIFVNTLLPLYLVPLAASTLHGIMTNRAATDSCCVSMCALLRFKIQQKDCLEDGKEKQKQNTSGMNNDVSIKLQYSLIAVLFLGHSALVGSMFLGLFDFAYEQPHIFYGGMLLTGSLWSLFILFIFFKRKKIRRSSTSKSNKVGDTYQTDQRPSMMSSTTNASDVVESLETELANVRR